MSAPKTFFITGVSSGFGRALATEALAAGHRVAGTLRNEAARAEFDALSPGRSVGVLLDVTDTAAIAPAVEKVEAAIGPIDVLVNNAGYGHEGTVEESPLDDLRRQFDVNVFGAVAVIQAVLPFMRTRRSGHIVNITSMGGIITFPGIAFYHGSKFALEGISESLGKEVKGFGIAVTAVEPGGFRTDWAGRSMVRAAHTITDYDEVFGTQRAARQARNGKQSGDPAKAARAILQLVEAKDPPAHLLLGPDAVKLVDEKLTALQAELKAWEQVSLSTDFD
ncbi:NAD(P)-dependent dehydrogenase (short-subunit alcohol dehydrogenase family) [Inquilinus ginsengisoli]|uniref:NAD(P)-dependent dehydrogenase (Short-subunit alcohol dehydrogenase family) n=1 Tax=Inquilinus ginsengisoli TaxID=363840 RepID=A0ABU1JLF3_9PROT|nr:oxidoreductase [Inquilinus ginsengisoli]MDR6289438.1 NAD(P)-dependent dehydrogenase (short-subunit alcohol dehydrogenase family) [Inquilinus ginsengisoli]